MLAKAVATKRQSIYRIKLSGRKRTRFIGDEVSRGNNHVGPKLRHFADRFFSVQQVLPPFGNWLMNEKAGESASKKNSKFGIQK